MAASEPKTVRLTDPNSGVVVSTDEDTASRLYGFEPVQEKKSTSKTSSK